MERKYIGIKWDTYTPAVQARLFRDLLALREYINKWPGQEFGVVCTSPDADTLLIQLGIPRVQHESLASFWRVYAVEQEPELPDNADTISLVDMRPSYNPSRMRVDQHWGGRVLNEQGRPYGDTSLIMRPAPNGYTPVSPGFLALWT